MTGRNSDSALLQQLPWGATSPHAPSHGLANDSSPTLMAVAFVMTVTLVLIFLVYPYVFTLTSARKVVRCRLQAAASEPTGIWKYHDTEGSRSASPSGGSRETSDK